MNNNRHISVFTKEAINALNIKKDCWYLDATFGRGGHTQAILTKKGKVLALDFDQKAISYAQENFKEAIQEGRLIVKRSNFNKLKEVVNELKKEAKINQLNGILFDFGTSTEQLTSSGFSFNNDGVLDMRMDDRLGVQAKDILALVPANQLEQLFRELGGETEAKKIAQAIKRSKQPITTTNQLAKLVSKTKKKQKSKLHPATKVFQALRIAVNMELENISDTLPQVLEVLTPQARVVTIAFHEGEDRKVKQAFRQWEKDGQGTVITKKPLVPSDDELTNNPRSRSAKLRIFEKNKS